MSLDLHGTFVGGSLELGPHSNKTALISGNSWLNGTTVRGQISLSGLAIANNMVLQNAEVGEDLFCRTMNGHCPVIGGQMSLSGTTVRGSVDFSGATIAGDLTLANVAVGLPFSAARGTAIVSIIGAPGTP